MTRSLDTTITDRLCQILELEPDQVFLSRSPLDLSFVSGIRDALHSRPELFYKKRSPQPPAAVDPKRRMLDQAL